MPDIEARYLKMGPTFAGLPGAFIISLEWDVNIRAKDVSSSTQRIHDKAGHFVCWLKTILSFVAEEIPEANFE